MMGEIFLLAFSGRLIRPLSAGFRVLSFVSNERSRTLAGRAGHTLEHDEFSELIYEEQSHEAERELLSFVQTVKESYGPEQATVSIRDWLDESDLMDSPPRSEVRDWHSVTIAASARLASRLGAT